MSAYNKTSGFRLKKKQLDWLVKNHQRCYPNGPKKNDVTLTQGGDSGD